MAANKPSSSSPIPSSRPNLNSRNSEIKDPMGRSFTGNPFSKPSSIVANSRGGGGFNPNTPANSPSDFPRRSSTGRESLSSLRDFEDKENSKDSNLKFATVRSPASASKGTKNFMSPTIYAAPKFAKSPRKKILAERNEPVRSSVSFFEAKVQAMEDHDSKPEISLGKKKTVSFSDVRHLIMEENDFSKPEMGLNQIETVWLISRNSEIKDPMRRSFTGNPFSKPSSIVANSRGRGGFNPNTPAYSPSDFPRRSSTGRESLSSLRDFEDKENSKDSNLKSATVRSPASASKGTKNFMSPTISAAPKFAKSPRKKILAERNEPVRSSVSFSEAKVQAMEDHDSKPEISLGKKKTVSFSDVRNLIMEENDFSKPEMGLNQIVSSHDSTKEESVQVLKFFTRAMFIAFVLVSSIAYILSSFRGMHTLGPLQYGNLTVLLEKDHLVDGHLKFVQKDASADFNYEKDFLASIRERNLKSEPLQHEEIEDDENTEEEENSPEFEEQVLVHQEIEVHDNINEASEDHTDSLSEELCSSPMAPVIKPDLEAQQTQEIVESNVETDIKLQSNNIDLAQQHVVISEGTQNQPAVKISEVIENQPNVAVLEVAEIQPEVSFAEDPQGETDLNSELDALSANLQNSATFNGSENNYLTNNVVGISLSVLLSLLAATTFFTYANAKKGKTSTSHVDQPALTKKFSPISGSAEHTFQERLSSRNWQTQVEMVGESCPSEMSSFKGSSYRKEVSEAQSQERKQQPRNNYRRESLASSEFSMGSPSYGSFTTCEKFSSKVLKGCGEDEVVTPVRRSSRIRKQVTSCICE